MRRDWLAWALTGFWDWASPGLTALEPAAMAHYEAFRVKGTSPAADADVAPGAMSVPQDRLSEPAVRTQFWAEGSER